MTLLLGGTRSGKSALAVRLAARLTDEVTVIATAEPRDAEMAERIARHRSERPETWATIEEPRRLEVVGSVTGTVILDCLTLWVSNLMEAEISDVGILDVAAEHARAFAGRSGRSFVVSNEVGWGIVPDNPAARRFRDLLGGVNRLWAGEAEEVHLVVAGRSLALQRPS